MNSSTQATSSDTGASDGLPAQPKQLAWSAPTALLFIALAIGLLGILQLFYGTFYSIHPDLAGGALSGRLAVTLGDAFAEYSLYFPPAEKAWFSLAARLSELTGLRLDLAIVLMTSTAVLFSGGLAYRIRQESVGATPLFLIVSVGVLVTVPIVFMNVFGLREHLVVLGLWPYFVLRISDHDDAKIGWRTRLVLGLWLGATLLFKYLYSLVVLLVELADAAVQRRPWAVLRVENLVSGAIVALYLFFWLVLDPSQREAIAVVVSAIDANLTDHRANLLNAAVNLALAIVFLLIARIFKLPARTTLIGLAMVVGAVIAAWIQSRWYIQHLLPVTMAYIAWWWMARGKVATLWVVALALLIAPAIFGAFIRTGFYQATVQELDTAIDQAGLSVEGKRVGVLIMNPSPLNQYLASSGAWRWNVSVNNSYVAAELYHLDKPENIGIAPPPVKLDVPGRKKLHDDMLRLWEDMPPDVLILDHSRSWPLNYVEVKWTQVFSEDQRFRAFLAQYRPVLHHDGDLLDFKYYVRKD